MAMPTAAVAATLGTMTTANRRHLVPPRTSDSILFLLLGRTSPAGMFSPGLGWEKCYVLGKESAGDRRTVLPSREYALTGVRTAMSESSAITPERQPLATLSRNLLD